MYAGTATDSGPSTVSPVYDVATIGPLQLSGVDGTRSGSLVTASDSGGSPPQVNSRSKVLSVSSVSTIRRVESTTSFSLWVPGVSLAKSARPDHSVIEAKLLVAMPLLIQRSTTTPSK